MQTGCSIAKAFHNSCSTTLVWDEITFCHKNSDCCKTLHPQYLLVLQRTLQRGLHLHLSLTTYVLYWEYGRNLGAKLRRPLPLYSGKRPKAYNMPLTWIVTSGIAV